MLAMPTIRPAPAGRPTRPPVHVGEHIKEDVLPDLGLTVAEAAEAIGVSRQTLYKLCAGEISLTAEMAVRLAKLIGVEPRQLLSWQTYYDVWHAEEKLRDEIKAIKTRRAREDR